MTKEKGFGLKKGFNYFLGYYTKLEPVRQTMRARKDCIDSDITVNMPKNSSSRPWLTHIIG